jgi:flagellar operon protein
MSIDAIGLATWQAQRPATTGRGSEAAPPQTAFDALLDQVGDATGAPLADPTEGSSLRFSRHAQARLRSRDMDLTESDVADLEGAVDRLADKGARESLVLSGENAFIVGVPRRTVITAMPRAEAVGSIFTNIDSTLVVR